MKILILNQTFYPDVVSSAQHATDLARALTANGHQTTIVCSRRSYDSPSITFLPAETWQGVTIRRIGGTGFGKGSKTRRALDFASFLVFCFVRMCTLGRFDCIVTLTSPPLISFLGLLFARITSARLVLWMMDMNPDEAIAAGWLREHSFPARVLSWCLACSLRGAAQIVALDRFMRERIVAKGISAERVSVVAPWIQSDAVRFDLHGRRQFRERHGLADKFVVMYSGNHSPCHPLDSLLQAAEQLRCEPDIAFCFVGGGSEYKKVEEFKQRHELHNILCLPYQPLKHLSASLSAADLHAVVMGDPFVGIVHPCKIYNVMAIGAPVLYIGPPESHITDLGVVDWLSTERHGDLDGTVRHIRNARDAGARRYESACVQACEFSQERLIPLLSTVIVGREQLPTARKASAISSEAATS